MSTDRGTATSEQDLRDALRSLVPDDLDAGDFRARFDALVAQRSDALPDDDTIERAVPDVTPISVARSGRRARLGRAASLLTAAAVVAALVGLVFAVRPTDRHRPRPGSDTSVSSAIREALLPGTIVLKSFRGRGSATLAVPSPTVPEHFDYEALVTCSGGGSLRVHAHQLITPCRAGGVYSMPGVFTGTKKTGKTLKILAGQRTSWQIAVALVPDLRTNAGLQSPVSADLRGPDNYFRRSGAGTRTVRFAQWPQSADPPADRVELVCHGSGVRIAGVTSAGQGLSTNMCFAGREYVWDGVHVALPRSLRVVAAPGTTWTIAVGKP